MKKMMALLLAAALLLPAVPGLAEADAVAGSWYARMGGVTAELTLNTDGTYALSVPGGDTAAGVWVFDDGYLYLDGAAVPTMATWGENTLMLGDSAGFFTREKPAYYAPADPLLDAPLARFAGYWVCQYVEVNGTPIPADDASDRTDLYIEGHSAILGSPRFGDAQVKLTFADGALTCEHAGTQVTLQIQQDGFLRLTTAPDAAVLYLLHAAALDEALDEDLDDTP